MVKIKLVLAAALAVGLSTTSICCAGTQSDTPPAGDARPATALSAEGWLQMQRESKRDVAPPLTGAEASAISQNYRKPPPAGAGAVPTQEISRGAGRQ